MTTATELWDKPIVTEVTPINNYYRADDYHQNYYLQNPTQGYFSAVVGPKVAKFRKKFAHKLKNAGYGYCTLDLD